MKKIVTELLPPSFLYVDFFDDDSFACEYIKIRLDEICKFAKIGGGFSKNCWLIIPTSLRGKLLSNRAKLQITKMGNADIIDGLTVVIHNFSGFINIRVASTGKVIIGNCGQLNLDLRIGHDSDVIIGDKTTSNGTRIVAINSTIAIKKDCMLSDEILIQGFDQHGIIDLNKNEIINNYRKETIIERHSWIGRKATIMPGVTINEGAIVGTGAVVIRSVKSCAAVAGVPAKTVKENITWCRPWTHIDADTADFISSIE
jgi:acetyltransferase-like isoleucine patch superfamily enzyme